MFKFFSSSHKKVLTLFMLLLTANALAETKISTILADNNDLPIECKTILIDAAEIMIGPKRHRIIENPSSNGDIFSAFILLSYNDQESHINFTAIPSEQGCNVGYNESFEINIPCVDARESLFKRWRLLGKLSDSTIVMRYDFPRDKKTLPKNENDRANAYLTQTRRGTACLVTKKQQHLTANPTPEQ